MNNIKMLRHELNISLRDLEKYTGIASATLNRLELERRPLKENHLITLSVFFSVTIDFLLGKSNFGYKMIPEGAKNDEACIYISRLDYQKSLISGDIKTKIILENGFHIILRIISGNSLVKFQEINKKNININVKNQAQIHRINEYLSRLNDKNLDAAESFVMDLFFNQNEMEK